MKFDRTQQITGVVAVIFIAYFIAHTVHLYNQSAKGAVPKPDTSRAAPASAGPATATEAGHNAKSHKTASPEAESHHKPHMAAIPAGTTINQTTNAPYSANVVGNNATVTIGKVPSPPRHLSEKDQQQLMDALSQGKGNDYRVIGIGREAIQYANEIRTVFDQAGWIPNHNLDVGTMFSNEEGGSLMLITSNENSDLVKLVKTAFKSVGLNLGAQPYGYTGPASLGRPEIVIVVNAQE